MQLSRLEFDRRYQSGTLAIALVGMSNIGKSYTGMRLATDYDFALIEVDKLIWEKLGHDDMAEFAEWQGQPYSDGYAEREAYSISLEKEATLAALNTQAKNPLIDTTGSVIYTGNDVLSRLRNNYFIVHIQADKADLERLKILYFNHPKPLIWAGHFARLDGMSDEDSIMDCYPRLLAAREKTYGEIADISIPSSYVMDPAVNISEIFETLKPAA